MLLLLGKYVMLECQTSYLPSSKQEHTEIGKDSMFPTLRSRISISIRANLVPNPKYIHVLVVLKLCQCMYCFYLHNLLKSTMVAPGLGLD